MVSDGSMALLRAITGSLDKNYNYNILDDNILRHSGGNNITTDIIKDREVDYYHLVVCAESTVN